MSHLHFANVFLAHLNFKTKMGKRSSTKEQNGNLLYSKPEEYSYTIKSQRLQQLLRNAKHRLEYSRRNLSRTEHRIVDEYMGAFTNRSNGFDTTSEFDLLQRETTANEVKLQELAANQQQHPRLFARRV